MNKEKICIWLTNDTKCHGKIEERKLFSDQIRVLICEDHYNHHLDILACSSYDDDIEKIITWDKKKRKKFIKENNIKRDKI